MEEEDSEGADAELATNEGGVECPLCQKEFETESSVQGHISGSTDETHRGKVGQNVMEFEASESSSIAFPESPEMDMPDPTEPAAESEPEPEPEIDSEMSESDGPVSESDGDLDEDGSSSSSPMSSLIGVAGLAALLWFLSQNGESDPDVPEVMIL